jgi:hypothetical protein
LKVTCSFCIFIQIERFDWYSHCGRLIIIIVESNVGAAISGEKVEKINRAMKKSVEW